MVSFNPPLPQKKQQSIEKLGFGVVNKIVLFFPTIFWDRTAHYIGNVGDHRGEGYLFLNLAKCMGYPVLVSMLSGKDAMLLTLTDSEIVDSALAFLRKVLFSLSLSLSLCAYLLLGRFSRTFPTR